MRIVGQWKGLRAERWLQRPESPSQIALKCAHQRDRERLFVACRHWQLRTGHVLEVRWLPSYVDAPIDLIVWTPAAEPGAVLGVGESFAGTGLRACLVAARDFLKPGACRVCGCTERDCSQCVERTGAPCHWVEPSLCSSCFEQIVGLLVDPDQISELAAALKQREQREETEPPSERERAELDWLGRLVREAEESRLP